MIFSLTGQAVLGWLLADLVTGIFHWWEDRFGREDWPIVGAWLIAPNQLHHRDPLAFTRHGFIARNGASVVAALAFGFVWCWAFGSTLMLATFMIGAGLSNEVHRFAHQRSAAGPIIRVLQQTGAWQSPKVHAAHHRPPHDANFCVLTDWLNPVLEAVGFWRSMERLLRRKS